MRVSVENRFLIRVAIFIATFVFSAAHGYVLNRGFDGQIVSWPSNVSSLSLQVNSANSSGLSTSQVVNALQNSLNKWNGQSRISINQTSSTIPPQINVNNVFFSSSSLYFSGNDVIAVTQVAFSEADGKILEADIILNDNHLFSELTSNSLFIEDVFSHELGHSLGLSHSQLHGASMFFELENGQDTLSEDDMAGAIAQYPISAAKGSLSGKVVGGSSLVGVFGAHVRAISTKTGKVTAAGISDTDGSFNISGLPFDDQYYLYVSPTKAISTIPSYFSDVKDNFCDSRSSFRGSFYQSCSSKEEGFPQAIALNGSIPAINVGNITIRCGLDVPQAYLGNKIVGGVTNIDSLSTSSNGSQLYVGNSFVGFFTQLKADQRSPDLFQIDLSSESFSNFSHLAGKDLYLEIKTVSQSLYSQLQLDMEVTPIGQSALDFKFDGFAVNADSDGNPDIDLVARVPLDELIAGNNIFDIKLTPRSVSQFIIDSSFSVTEEKLFPSGSSNFNDDLIFYLVIVNVSEKVGNNFEVVSMEDPGILTDNSQCPDGNNTFTVAGNTVDAASSSSRLKKNEDPFACGTIDTQNGGPGGPFNILLGFCLASIIGFLSRSRELKS